MIKTQHKYSKQYEHCDSDKPEEATVEVGFEDRAPVQVQLSGGRFGPDCLIFVDGEEYEGCSDAPIMIEAIRLAESYAKEAMGRFIRKPLGFNCSLNNCDFFLRVDPDTGSAEIMGEDHVVDDYRPPIRSMKAFESEQEALDFADRFRTDEHFDSAGLYAMLNAID